MIDVGDLFGGSSFYSSNCPPNFNFGLCCFVSILSRLYYTYAFFQIRICYEPSIASVVFAQRQKFFLSFLLFEQ